MRSIIQGQVDYWVELFPRVFHNVDNKIGIDYPDLENRK
jgi:hypothetical protein